MRNFVDSSRHRSSQSCCVFSTLLDDREEKNGRGCGEARLSGSRAYSYSARRGIQFQAARVADKGITDSGIACSGMTFAYERVNRINIKGRRE